MARQKRCGDWPRGDAGALHARLQRARSADLPGRHGLNFRRDPVCLLHSSAEGDESGPDGCAEVRITQGRLRSAFLPAFSGDAALSCQLMLEFLLATEQGCGIGGGRLRLNLALQLGDFAGDVATAKELEAVFGGGPIVVGGFLEEDLEENAAIFLLERTG